MEPYEQHGESIHETRRGIGAQGLRVQGAIGEGEPQVPRDEHGHERLTLLVQAPRDDGHGLDGMSMRCSVRSTSYSRRAISSVVSLIATT